MLGVDYSPTSIQLAEQIQQRRSEEADENEDAAAPVHFQQHDLLSPEHSPSRTFSVLLDKGTFDAISLSSTEDANGRRISEQYRARILPFLADNGLLILTSCNWTEPELRSWFEKDDGLLSYKTRLRYPSFRFGGIEGQTVVTLCFQKSPPP
jgi:hypothetical protein